jgi:hypothetical protein
MVRVFGGAIGEGIDQLHVEHPLVRRRVRHPAAGEGVDHAGEGRDAVLAQARLGEPKLGLQGLASVGDEAQALLGEARQPLRRRGPVCRLVAQPVVRDQGLEALQVADIDLQRHLDAVVEDGDLGDVGGSLGAAEVDPIGPRGAQRQQSRQEYRQSAAPSGTAQDEPSRAETAMRSTQERTALAKPLKRRTTYLNQAHTAM